MSARQNKTETGAQGAPPLAELVHVFAAAGETVVLHDVSLTIADGESLAILGPNGCGKSTLLRLLSCEGYPVAREGTAFRIFGRERWDVAELRTQLGVVGTAAGASMGATLGRDAVVTGFFGSSTLWPHLRVTAAMREAAEEALERMQAVHLGGKLVREMSAGEARRIAIARALVHRPRALILDEPSNALDLRAALELRESLQRLAAEGTGLVMVTHHLPDLLPEMRRAVLMRAGRIFADGPREAVITERNLRALFGVEVQLLEQRGYFHAWA